VPGGDPGAAFGFRPEHQRQVPCNRRTKQWKLNTTPEGENIGGTSGLYPLGWREKESSQNSTFSRSGGQVPCDTKEDFSLSQKPVKFWTKMNKRLTWTCPTGDLQHRLEQTTLLENPSLKPAAESSTARGRDELPPPFSQTGNPRILRAATAV